LEDSKSNGAKVVTGGKPFNPPGAGGCFFEPTLITGVKESMQIAKEEIFGPIASIIK
jgi:succinate-semialdehyde dehydrogenase/glutarate-semialdehyde dehydrogenase